jgi:hypothetical protein
MDAEAALAELTGVAAWVDSAAIVAAGGEPLAATGPRGDALARAAAGLIETASRVRPARTVAELEVALATGSVHIVRGESATIAAVTLPGAVAPLVRYDLQAALRAIAPAKPKRRRPAKKKAADVEA